MKNYTEKELREILDKHELWLASKGGKKAHLCGALSRDN